MTSGKTPGQAVPSKVAKCPAYSRRPGVQAYCSRGSIPPRTYKSPASSLKRDIAFSSKSSLYMTHSQCLLKMFHTANVAEQSQVTTGYSILHAVLIIIFAFLACAALLLRIWSRRIQCIALNLSDYVTILGLVCWKQQNTHVGDTEREYLRSLLWLMLGLLSTVCRL